MRSGSTTFTLVCTLSVLVQLLPLESGRAQLSPGKLAAPHEALEGILNCTKCHKLGEAIDGSKCLECHSALRESLDAGKGYHAEEKLQARTCVSCHSDHHGRAFEMISWVGERSDFQHSLAGWKLEGAHGKISCRACHNPQHLDSDWVLRHEHSTGDSTWLGLDTSCIACHKDYHLQQLSENCLECHNLEAWLPADRFSHDQTRYPLAGAHRNLTCTKCHPKGSTPAQGVLYQVKDFKNCSSCHETYHRVIQHEDCASCHTVANWKTLRKAFDHNLTAYPLRGAHQDINCEGCHPPARENRWIYPEGFTNCECCHQDPHAGQFLQNGPQRACSSCHTVEQFNPSLFGLERHLVEPFVLEGAHLAAACVDCHRSESEDSLVHYRVDGMGFVGSKCQSCHTDPHPASDQKLEALDACLTCHTTLNWELSSFQHDGTEFPLRAAHARIPCKSCHQKEQRIVLGLMERDCHQCHQDPHRSQFVFRESGSCSVCHSADNWRITVFNHDNSRFQLDGQHAAIACAHCHGLEEDDKGTFVRYRPLGFLCTDCHGEQVPKKELHSR